MFPITQKVITLYDSYRDFKNDFINGKIESLCPLVNPKQELFGGASGTNTIKLWMESTELEDELLERMNKLMDSKKFKYTGVINVNA